MGAISGAVFAQSGANLPLQRGVSVQLAVTTNAVAVPNADRQDALVVALTAEGTTYLRADRVPTPDLANRVRSVLSTQQAKRSTSRPTLAFRMHASLRLSMLYGILASTA